MIHTMAYYIASSVRTQTACAMYLHIKIVSNQTLPVEFPKKEGGKQMVLFHHE